MAHNTQTTGLLDGESSDYVPETSGVSRGTVLGPLMFLIYNILMTLLKIFRLR